MANKKSSSELKAELDSLLASYQANNVDVETIKRAHNDLERSLRWLRNNNDADQAQIEYHKSIVESRRDYASAYNKIKMLDTKINKRCKEEEEEAASSLFCLLFSLYKDTTITATYPYNDYNNLHNTIVNEFVSLLNSDDLKEYRVGLYLLEEMDIFELEDDGSIDSESVQLGVFQFLLLVDEYIKQNPSIPFNELVAVYHSKLESGLIDTFNNAVQNGALNYYHGGEYSEGDNWEQYALGDDTEFTVTQFIHFEYIAGNMYKAVDNDDMPFLTGAITQMIKEEGGREVLTSYLQILLDVEIIDYDNDSGIITHNSKTFYNVHQWLRSARRPVPNQEVVQQQRRQSQRIRERQRLQQQQQQHQPPNTQQQSSQQPLSTQQRVRRHSLMTKVYREQVRRLQNDNDCSANGNQCHACRRRQMTSAAENDNDPYRLTFHQVHSSSIN